MKITMRNTAFVLLLAAILLPSVALAAPMSAPIELGANTLPKGPGSIIDIIEVIADWIFTILLVLAVIFILLAAYHYLGGGEEGVHKAHRMLLFTAVAVAVAFLAVGFVTAVQMLVKR